MNLRPKSATLGLDQQWSQVQGMLRAERTRVLIGLFRKRGLDALAQNADDAFGGLGAGREHPFHAFSAQFQQPGFLQRGDVGTARFG